MLINTGDLLVWEIVASNIIEIAPDESEIIADIAWSSLVKAKSIGYRAGAMDGGSVVSEAATVVAVLVTALKAYAPKLFDAAIDITKDVVKKRIVGGDPIRSKPECTVLDKRDIQELRELIVAAAIRQKIAPSKIDPIADAVIAAWLTRGGK